MGKSNKISLLKGKKKEKKTRCFVYVNNTNNTLPENCSWLELFL